MMVVHSKSKSHLKDLDPDLTFCFSEAWFTAFIESVLGGEPTPAKRSQMTNVQPSNVFIYNTSKGMRGNVGTLGKWTPVLSQITNVDYPY